MEQRETLREYEPSKPLLLSTTELRRLKSVVSRLKIETCLDEPNHYILTPGSYVGVIRTENTQLDILPKIPINRLFFILSYAVDPIDWHDDSVDFAKDDGVLEAVAPIFRRLISQATRRGLLHGYREREESLSLVRGQIRMADQLRQHHGRLLPVEVRYDEFTEDIAENRILLAALQCLRRLTLRSAVIQRSLHEVTAAFQSVSMIKYSASEIPSIQFTRLNQHYESAIRLATLILRSASPEIGQDDTTGTAFLLNMNEVFEMFVHRALREALQLTEDAFPRGDKRLRLDQNEKVKLEPDLSWWKNGVCQFVGDAKYKRIKAEGIKHPDLYQLLAYTIAADLPSGLLIYAAGEDDDAQHMVKIVGKRLNVVSLDLDRTPAAILDNITTIAKQLRHPEHSVVES
jgi:5-methylcytosine-specific restriction enzyme subunit McrC